MGGPATPRDVVDYVPQSTCAGGPRATAPAASASAQRGREHLSSQRQERGGTREQGSGWREGLASTCQASRGKVRPRSEHCDLVNPDMPLKPLSIGESADDSFLANKFHRNQNFIVFKRQLFGDVLR